MLFTYRLQDMVLLFLETKIQTNDLNVKNVKNTKELTFNHIGFQ